MNQVKTYLRTPQRLVDEQALFTIPSYQRPFVWSDEAIKSLFDDLFSAFESKQPHYYVGTILTAKRPGQVLELIDGQQRTTSLMLFALACKKKEINTQLTKLICAEHLQEETLRLSFKIRTQVEAYLGHMAGLENYENQYPSDTEIENNPYLKRLAAGLATFENLLDQIPFPDSTDQDDTAQGNNNRRSSLTDKQAAFADYVYSSMHMVENRIPTSTDLNQLFATMNNSGVQLEQADILKSLLLKNIETDKATYNTIWQACENMDNYFERNVRKVFPNTNWAKMQNSDFAQYDAGIFNFDKADEDEKPLQGMTIAEIMASVDNRSGSQANNKYRDVEEETREVYCHSIISFPQLLLHTYRIYLQKYGFDDFVPRFHSDQLIATFEPLLNSDEEQIKQFFQLLWQVRFAFDLWIVKWVEKADEVEEQLLLCSVNGSYSNNNYYFSRSPLEHSNISMLQMVRHFTADRNAQYWLTPFLGWLVENKPTQVERAQVVKQLESIDNQLSLAMAEQKPASFKLLSSSLGTSEVQASSFIKSYLSEKNGVNFRHYWFQKLEYLLWKHNSDYLKDIDQNKFMRYRIISRNSVEHVHPQNDEYGKQLEDGYLDSFGNLALLNVGQNSAYSNQSVGKKREDFNAKPQYDSLKLKHIYDLMQTENGLWDESKIHSHQNQMITLLKAHYCQL
ncbi:DUF262 domain-containing protein [Photobacterium profundum]|uniref:DUF262 domain-containing protein n=1 Tax=Photobacterium profundum (strain SS9) TaxID=298386 RepID=Q6LTS8_PHOPR|nr:DUF262 domain-containing protein [Photobacterium profundum]CAG19297.1 conserved hypothetical protein [Photobacterium profundum SS9]